MPGGRPPLPGTAEEKARARRERIRLNVRAHRARKKHKELDEGDCTSTLEDRDTKALLFRLNSQDCKYIDETELWAPPVVSPVDISEISCKAPIDTSFGSVLSVVHDFERLTGRYPWMMALQEFPTSDKIVEAAMMAAGAAFLSRLSNDCQLAAFSKQSYDCALRKLRWRMENSAIDEHLMLSTVSSSLMAFESANGAERTEKSAWGAHARASSHFLEQAGPAATRSDIGRQLLRGNRLVAIQLAIHERRPCFLDTDAWATVPFEPGTKTLEDELVHIVSRVPEHISHADVLSHRLRVKDKFVLKTAMQLRERILQTQNDMREWIWRFYEDPLAPPTRSYHKSPQFHVDLAPLFPCSLYFADHTKAESNMTYWTVILFIHLLVRAISHGLKAAGLLDLSESFRALLEDDPEDLATNICQSMEFCIGTDENDLRGAFYGGFLPLQAVLRYYRTDQVRYAEEIEWALGVSRKIANMGIHYPEYVNKNAAGDSVLESLYRV